MAITTHAVPAGQAAAARDAVFLVPDHWLSERLNTAAFTLAAAADARAEPPTRPAFLQTKVDIAVPQRVEELVRAGYALVETAVVLRKEISRSVFERGRVRFAKPFDESSVRKIAGAAFTYSRFHNDPAIPRETADAIKREWAGNFFRGSRGTHMVVAEEGGLVVGFLLLIDRGDDLIVDLVGVAPQLQGRGFGRAMLDFAAASIVGPRWLVVGTQLLNIPSLAYYGRYGFLIEKACYSLHRHVV